MPEDIVDGKPTPIEDAIGSETHHRYQDALQRLPENQRKAVLLRVELGLSYQEIAEELGRPNANAARQLVSRGIERLSREMNEHA
jgi:RNA polymerase sigma-70 factor (ECF subfamily)